MDRREMQGTGITNDERKAALALFPYFSKNPIVFDVGSNKGHWADILIQNVDRMYLIEPNDRLLTYTMVKFDYLKNVNFCDYAISNQNSISDFHLFTDSHNGLSNIIANAKWSYLNPEILKIETRTIASLSVNIDHIDLLKIDVEGAEFLVLQGAESLLKNKQIKFIQIEKSEHYDFAPVPDYVRQFGYDVFHFDGDSFVKWIDQQSENLYIMDAEFTQDWNGEFIKNTQFLKGRIRFALEIGVFEGMTSRYICDNLLDKSVDSRMIAVDPLTDEYLPDHPDNHLFVGQYDRFVRNTKGYPVELIQKRSELAFKSMEHYRFDFIYVDGDHRYESVYSDAVNSFNVCSVGGYILFDDYEWRDDTKRGIDRFLGEYYGFVEVVSVGYQVMVKKLKNK